jgi:prepilin-type N-terminal cleavage/methylation domain-containing protein
MAASKLRGERDGMMEKRRGAAVKRRQQGFSLLEMIMATAVLIIGLVGVAQLIPASLLLNSGNRVSSAALVMAQQEMDQLVNQPLNLPVPQQFTDSHGFPCMLGDPTQPSNTFVGSPILMANNLPLIDFSQDQVDGYSFNYVDLNDPSGTTWDVRWAVITTNPTGTVIGKRFIVGARQIGGANFVLPVTLDTMVAK